jgi:hypothetical protein
VADLDLINQHRMSLQAGTMPGIEACRLLLLLSVAAAAIGNTQKGVVDSALPVHHSLQAAEALVTWASG